ncbi:GNAT family acetyltransferase [Bifidobacterium dentium]|uniref:GNAT family acetyltransferase n=1 Tax=Bifidobacterium dentium TaxID=1689 RepID=UPI003D186D6C
MRQGTSLDSWLVRHVLNTLDRVTTITYVAMDGAGVLDGFYPLSANSVNCIGIGQRLDSERHRLIRQANRI